MSRKQLFAFLSALLAASVAWSCSRSMTSEGEVVGRTPSATIPENLQQLQPALVKLIKHQVEAVRAAPRNPSAHAALGLIYEANHLGPEARTCFEIAQSLQPDEPMWPHHAAIAAIASGDFDGALTLLRDAAARFPNFPPIQHRFGNALLKTAAYEEAAHAFDRIVRSAPGHCAGYVGLGDVNLRRGRYPEAIELLERAVGLEPGYKKAHYLLGMAYRAIGRDHDAREQLRLGVNAKTRYLEDAWGSKVGKYRVSVSTAIQTSAEHRSHGRIQQAIRVLEDALAFHHEDAELLTNLGTAYLETSETLDALRVFLQADKINPNNLSIPINLVTCYLRLHRVEDALRASDRAVNLGPEVWQAHYNRGVVLMELNRWEDARESLLAAVNLKPTEPGVYGHLGDVCMRLDRHAEGRIHFEDAARRWPEYLPARLGIVDACMELRDWNAAAVALEAVRKRAPDDPRVIKLSEQLSERRQP